MAAVFRPLPRTHTNGNLILDVIRHTLGIGPTLGFSLSLLLSFRFVFVLIFTLGDRAQLSVHTLHVTDELANFSQQLSLL